MDTNPIGEGVLWQGEYGKLAFLRLFKTKEQQEFALWLFNLSPGGLYQCCPSWFNQILGEKKIQMENEFSPWDLVAISWEDIVEVFRANNRVDIGLLPQKYQTPEIFAAINLIDQDTFLDNTISPEEFDSILLKEKDPNNWFLWDIDCTAQKTDYHASLKGCGCLDYPASISEIKQHLAEEQHSLLMPDGTCKG